MSPFFTILSKMRWDRHTQTQPKMVCPADANLASKVIFEGGAHSHIIAKLIYEKSSRFIGLFG